MRRRALKVVLVIILLMPVGYVALVLHLRAVGRTVESFHPNSAGTARYALALESALNSKTSINVWSCVPRDWGTQDHT